MRKSEIIGWAQPQPASGLLGREKEFGLYLKAVGSQQEL